MDIDHERRVDAVEFDRFANRRLDDAWTAEHRRLMTADAIEPIERPHFRCLSHCQVTADQNGRRCRREHSHERSPEDD